MRTILKLCFLILSIADTTAQPLVPVGFDIPGALGVEASGDYIYLVEGGTGANDGRILSYDTDFNVTVVVEGLPSFFDADNQALESALNTYFINENQFYVIIGGGPGEDFGALVLFSLADYTNKGAPLTLDDAQNIIPISEWVLTQGYVESNPYAILPLANDDILITDAAANAVFRYSNGELSLFADIPSTPNSLPFGPPMIEPVPTQILAHPSGGYLVSTFTGFPFATGGATIYHLSEEGAITTYASGLTLLTDMAYDVDGSLLALQFANFGEMGFEFGTAQLLKVSTDGNHEVIASGFGASGGFDVANNGNIYASHLFLGQLLELERCVVDAGTLQIPSDRDEIEVCVGDGRPDLVSFDNKGAIGRSNYIITNEEGIILSITNNGHIDFENTGIGICYVYHVTTAGSSTVELGTSLQEIEACTSISNAITINRKSCEGCYPPVNLRYRKNAKKQFTLYWDQVKDAKGYELEIVNRTGKKLRILVRRRKVKLTISDNLGWTVAVRAICQNNQSEFTSPININYDAPIDEQTQTRSSKEISEEEEINLTPYAGGNVYPNPANDKITVQLNKHYHQRAEIRLFNLNGQIVKKQLFVPELQQLDLPISDVTPGVYFLQVSSDAGIIAHQLISVIR